MNKYLMGPISLWDWAHNFFWESYLGINTKGFHAPWDLNIQSTNKVNGRHYEASHYRLIRKAFQNLDIPYQNYSFVDLGCGKGRVLFYSQRFPFKNIIGVEYADDLIKELEFNLQKFKIKKGTDHSPISYHSQDVTQFSIPREPCVFFLFNPFNEWVLSSFLWKYKAYRNERVKEDLPDYFIYLNPLRSHLFENGEFQLFSEISSIKPNQEIKIYQH